VTDARTLAPLFRVPPEQFTAARNQLVAELRRAGNAPTAAAVAKLPRPTPVVWAINQVAHEDRAAIDRLVTVADQLRRAQLGRAPTEMPASAKTYREAVQALVERSVTYLKEAGRATTAATRQRLTQTLMAASTASALRELLREGQLSREEVATGFDVFGDARPALRVVKPSAAARPASRPPSTPPALVQDPDATRRRAEARVRLETARADLTRAESRAQELAKTEAELAQAASGAQTRAAAARRAAARARADVARARAAVAAAERMAQDR
jgi:hypothetical protein